VNEFDQAELIMMMFSGAVNFLDKAIEISRTDKIMMGAHISRAKTILLEIMSSLNLQEGGEIGKILLDTYSRQFRTLHLAQMTEDVQKIIPIRDSLMELGEAWKEVFNSEEYLAFKRAKRNLQRGVSTSG
jgi:flagellar protein FliS